MPPFPRPVQPRDPMHTPQLLQQDNLIGYIAPAHRLGVLRTSMVLQFQSHLPLTTSVDCLIDCPKTPLTYPVEQLVF